MPAPRPTQPCRECAAAASREGEAAGTGGSSTGGQVHRPGLHLVVLGHVDAGKSTLMGRLLYDLGHISAKDVHRNQRDAAAAGKVGAPASRALAGRAGGAACALLLHS